MVVEVPRIIITAHDGTPLGDVDPTRVAGIVVTSEVNGEHSMTLTTQQELTKGDRLLWRDRMGYWHEYVIESDEATHDATGAPMHAYWCPWSVQHDLAATFVTSMPGTGGTPATAREALTAALAGTSRWVVGTVGIATTGSASFWRLSGWEAMQELVKVWGGEVRATITVSPTTGVTGRAVDLLAHVGESDAKRRFDFGYDATGITRTVMDEQWTASVMPLGAAEQTDEGGYGRKITIESVNDGSAILTNADAVPLTRVPDGTGGWEVPVQVVENSDADTPADLKAWALEHLDEWTTPKVSYEATVAQLKEAGMDPTGVALGDEVAVVDRTFTAGGLRIVGRALRIEDDLLDPAQTTLTISNLQGTLGDTLTDIARATADVRGMVEGMSAAQASQAWVQNLLDRINADINATGGYTYITEGQGIRTYDVAVTDPLVGSEASAVCEVKGGTMRIANTKDAQGQWEWKTVFTSGRILAELIDAIGASSGYHAQLTPTGLDVYDGESRVAHFGEQAAFYDGDGQPLITVKAYSDNHEGMVDFGSDVGYISGSLHEYATYSWTDMIVQATTLLALRGPTVGVSASGLDTDVYGTSTKGAAASMTAQRAWTSNPDNLDIAGVSGNVYDTGNSPDASLYAHSASSVASVKVTASASHATVNLACDRLTLTDSIADPLGETGIYPTHGAIAQGTNVSAGGSVVHTISFGHTYAAPPTVVPVLYSTSTDAGIGKLSCVVSEITTTGAKIRVFNNDSQTRAPGVRWIALG